MNSQDDVMPKHKKFAQYLIDQEYHEWRKHPVICIFSPDGVRFDPAAALRARRLRAKAWRRDPAWVDMTRIWQIKGRLNYGRY